MLKNYLIIAIRKAIRDKAYTIINLFGLAIGLASFLFIAKYVDLERNMDNFHDHGKNIYRVSTDLNWNSTEARFPATPPAVGTTLNDQFGEIEFVTRIRPYHTERIIEIGDNTFREQHVMAVDSNFLKVFSFNILEGNPEKLFHQPNQVVVAETIAQKYFADENALNKFIDINGETYQVIGTIEDPPLNSHIQYSLLTSNLTDQDIKYFEWSWIWCNLVTYVKLNPNANAVELEAKFPKMVMDHAGNAIERITGKSIDAFFENGNHLGFYLEPLSQVYYSGSNHLGKIGNKTFLYIFAGVALIILLLACINYTNLSTARSLKRAKEIGLRKVVGTTRIQLHNQFLVESLMFSLTSTVLAVFIYQIINSQIAQHFGIRWDLSLFQHLEYLWFVFALSLLVGIISGLYPAFYLSRFSPSRALKGAHLHGAQKSPMRNMLIVFQFIVSFCIIIFTFSVSSQIRYLRNKDLGFDKENLVVISNINYLSNRNVFKNEVNQNSFVKSSTLSSSVPSQNSRGEIFRKPTGSEEDYLFNLIDADEDYLQTFGLTLKAGRNYTRGSQDRENPKLLINEEAKKHLEYESALGEQITCLDNMETMEVIGVIKDFDFFLSKDGNKPFILRSVDGMDSHNDIYFLTVKLSSSDLLDAVGTLEKIWKAQETGIPFQYHFYDQIFNDMYHAEIRLGGLMMLFTGLAITIALLGLVGLISFHTEQLTKSIGIRKVFGANVLNILSMITGDFFKLFIIAFLIAIPIANYGIKDWLESFVNKMDLSVWHFLLPGIIVFVIALSTIWIQSFKSATANPIDAIRNE